MHDDPANGDDSPSAADRGVDDSSSPTTGSSPSNDERSRPKAGRAGPDPSGVDRSNASNGRDAEGPSPRDGPLSFIRWLRSSEDGVVVFVREIVTSVLAVLAVGALLFAISGVWPPMVAVESGSMQPHMQKGDLVFVMDETRLQPDAAAGETGVVTYAAGVEADYRSFGDYGDVIVYRPDGDPARKPVIHRAHLWVEEGENWMDRADPAYVSGDSCESVPNCPAPHAGFITKGDNERTNDYYDQTRGISEPVKPSWIRGTAEVRIPWLGWVRLTFTDLVTTIAPPSMSPSAMSPPTMSQPTTSPSVISPPTVGEKVVSPSAHSAYSEYTMTANPTTVSALSMVNAMSLDSASA